jgi:hypothetical protein
LGNFRCHFKLVSLIKEHKNDVSKRQFFIVKILASLIHSNYVPVVKNNFRDPF